MQTVLLGVFDFPLGDTIAVSVQEQIRAHEVQMWMVRELLSQQ